MRIRNGDKEFLLWLTRRYTMLLLGVVETIATDTPPTDGSNSAREAVQRFQRDAALQGADFSTEYQETATEHPLGDEPILVSRLDYAVGASGKVRLTMASPQGKSVNANLTREMLFILGSMLEKAATKAQWGRQSVEATSSASAEHGGERRFH
jgi:hypothetical protein